MEDLTKRVVAAQADAREARDTAKEIAVILREQDLLERIGEVRTEGRKLVGDLRADVEHAFTPVRAEIKQLRADVDGLISLKTKGQGALAGGKWLLDILKVVAGAGGATVLIKLLEAAP